MTEPARPTSYEWTAESLFEDSRRLDQEHRDRLRRDPDHIDWDSEDPHEILGVDASATFDEISAVHRRMAKRFHPDSNPNASQAELERNLDHMGRVNEAFNELRAAHLLALRAREDQVARLSRSTDS